MTQNIQLTEEARKHALRTLRPVTFAYCAHGPYALHGAADELNLELVEALIKRGNDVNAHDCDGTPLHVIARSDDPIAPNIALALIEAGADTLATNKQGFTPFMIAEKNNAYGVMQVILEQRGDNEEDVYPLHINARENVFGRVRELVAMPNVDVNGRDNCEMTPLHHAVIGNALATAEILIEKGADVNAKDEDDNTPLDLAHMHDMPNDLKKALTDNGATAYTTRGVELLAA